VALDAGLQQLGMVWAVQIERDAKVNAPWTDRTTNARQTLGAFAVVIRNGKVAELPEYEPGIARGIALILRQYMSYGKYLELRWQGKYAIVLPTLQQYYYPVWNDVRGLQ